MALGRICAWRLFFSAILPVTYATDIWAAEPVADFYRGKTVTVVIGYSVGGGYDIYARLLARHMGRHTPGNPQFVPQNMPGAGSIKALEFIGRLAPKDGLTIGTFGRSLPLSPLLEGAKFSVAGFEWIGSITSDTSVCISWIASGVTSLDEMKKRQFTVGGLGKGSDPDMVATMMRNALGMNIKIVTGYPGSRDLAMAMERREIEGICGYTVSTIRSSHQDWLKQNRIAYLAQVGLQRDRDLPDVPLVSELAPGKLQRDALNLIAVSQTIARPFAAPPGTPQDRVQALRTAFSDTMADQEFLREAATMNLEVNPATGEQVTDLIRKAYATPDDVVQEAIRLIAD